MEQEKKGGGGKKWFFGCCGGLVVLAILCAGGSWFGAGYAKDEMASLLKEGVAESMEKTELSPEQRQGINAQTERLEAAIKGWGIMEAIEHLENLEPQQDELENFGFHIILVGYGSYILPHTAMPEEERDAGRRILQRYARGIDEGKLRLNDNDGSWDLQGRQDDGNEIEFDVDEVRRHLASLATKVDEVGIPDEPYEVDLANKLEQIVDALIAE